MWMCVFAITSINCFFTITKTIFVTAIELVTISNPIFITLI